MARIKILDSGYVLPDNTGTQLSTSDRVNSGDAVELDSVSVVLSSQSLQDATPTLNNFTVSNVNVSGFENDKITISGTLNPDSDSTLLYQLSRLTKTVGYKYIYYDWSTESGGSSAIKKTNAQVDRQLVYLMANSHVINPPVADMEHIHVRFESFNVSQLGTTRVMDWSLSGTILKV